MSLVLAACGGEGQSPDHDAVTVDLKEVGDNDEKNRALALLELHQLGYDEWVIKCAYAHARDDKPVEEAIENCGLGTDV